MVEGCGPACGGTGCAFAAGAGEGTWGVVAGWAVCVVAGCAWSGVAAGADIWTGVGCESAGCCATALSESSKVAETIQFKVRITLISVFLQYAKVSVRQLENNMHDRGGIHWLTIS